MSVKRQEFWLITLIVLLGLLYRLDFLFAASFSIDADEAVVGLMARHMLEGRGIPVFYYGQHYMGSFEAMCAAAVFSVFGSSPAALKAVPLAFSLALIVLLYQIGRELGLRSGARFAALLAALPPAALLEWSTKARGGFIELVVIGSWAILVTLRTLKEDRIRSSSLLHLAFLLGFGWWVNSQIIYFILPCKIALLFRIVRDHESPLYTLGRTFVCGCAGFVAGSLPFWIYNFTHSFVSFEMFTSAGKRGFVEHLSGMVAQSLPILLGARRFWQVSDIFPYATLLAFFIYTLLLLVVLAVRRGQCLKLFALRIERQSAPEVLLMLLGCAAVVFAASSFGYLVQAPRYLLPAYTGIFVLSGYAVEILLRRLKPLGVLCTACIISLNLLSFYLGGRAVPGEPFVFDGQRVSRDHSELNQWLERKGVSWVRTNYWIGYRLAFETGEKVRFEVFQEPHQTRIPRYVKEAREYTGEKPYVLVPAQAALVEKALTVLGRDYERAEASGYVIIFGVRDEADSLLKIKPPRHEITASFSPDHAVLAMDGDSETRWASAHPQEGGMEFSVRFETAATLRGIEYDLGRWAHDYPRALSIDLELASGEVRHLLRVDDYQAVRYFTQYEGQVRFVLKPLEIRKVILRQSGSHPVFDWSIAELRFYR